MPGHSGSTLRGTPAYSAGKFGTAMSGGVLALAGDMGSTVGTLEFWCRTTAGGVVVAVGSDGELDGAVAQGFWAGSSSGSLWVGVPAAGSPVIQTSATINDGAWHHVAIIVDGTNVRVGCDGSFVGSLAYGGTFKFRPGGKAACIGGLGTNLDYDWAGQVDEVRVSNVVRYTGSSYTVPTAPFADADDSTTALFHLNGSGADTSTASAPPTTTIGLNNAGVYLSPYNHRLIGGTSTQANPGSYLATTVAGSATIGLAVDVSALVAASVPAGRYPRIRWRVNDGAIQDRLLAASDTTIALATGLSGSNTVRIYLRATDAYTARWVGTSSLVATGIVLDSGGSVALPTVRPKRWFGLGDSITEGAWQLGGSADLSNYPAYEDATSSWLPAVAEAFDCEYGQCAFGGEAWDSAFNGDVPAFASAWPYYFGTNSRLTGGLLSPPPDFLSVCLGTNGGVASSSTVSGQLVALRAAAGAACKILVIVPPNGSARANLTAGVAAYQAAHTGDTATYLIDLGTIPELTGTIGTATAGTTDGIHPTVAWQGRLAARLAQAIRTAITPVSTGGSSPTLDQIQGAVVAGLTQQGLTTGRAANLDRLDATSSSIATAVAGATAAAQASAGVSLAGGTVATVSGLQITATGATLDPAENYTGASLRLLDAQGRPAGVAAVASHSASGTGPVTHTFVLAAGSAVPRAAQTFLVA